MKKIWQSWSSGLVLYTHFKGGKQAGTKEKFCSSLNKWKRHVTPPGLTLFRIRFLTSVQGCSYYRYYQIYTNTFHQWICNKYFIKITAACCRSLFKKAQHFYRHFNLMLTLICFSPLVFVSSVFFARKLLTCFYAVILQKLEKFYIFSLATLSSILRCFLKFYYVLLCKEMSFHLIRPPVSKQLTPNPMHAEEDLEMEWVRRNQLQQPSITMTIL